MSEIQHAHANRRDEGHPPITEIFVLVDVKDFPLMQLLNLSGNRSFIFFKLTSKTIYCSYFNVFPFNIKHAAVRKLLELVVCHKL